MPQSSVPQWQPDFTAVNADLDPRWACFSGNTSESGDTLPKFLVAEADWACHIPTSIERYRMDFYLPIIIMELSNF
jgi:hypothetical protein